eukprot:gnl/Chilomastix_caulleri/5454.p1 GENE.gnl/Chilomastix_caulleri/5454~~gnl/Chilomastix_caulleri/5454.p1  ORF type:complete len:89 (-),score=21.96 gnl/Chilomastix_caulleri/5454:29-295(-)
MDEVGKEAEETIKSTSKAFASSLESTTTAAKDKIRSEAVAAHCTSLVEDGTCIDAAAIIHANKYIEGIQTGIEEISERRLVKGFRGIH